ncbi:hypothetical protein FIBSPDRAFT_856127, partial [Athelia psychrophila]
WHHRLPALMDQQIFRPAGKATTLAAMTYCARHGRDFVVPPTGTLSPSFLSSVSSSLAR